MATAGSNPLTSPRLQETIVIATPHDQPSPADDSRAPAVTSPALTKPEIKKIQGLLESKTADGVTLGLSLLESLGATAADYEAVFAETVIRAVLKTWDAATWAAVSRAILPHAAVFETFRRSAQKADKWYRTKKDESFSGVLQAMIPAARLQFLAAWGDASPSAQPFIDLVDVPAGSFTMGSPDNEVFQCDKPTISQVNVRITKPFAIGRTVVTQAQWRAVMGSEPWRYELKKNQCADDFPAVYVNWDDAVLFCETLTGLERETGKLTASQSYRLPTEAEWEYACRAGTMKAYSFGDDPKQLGEYGWFEKNSGAKLHPVAQKKPNPWGLFDMHGNVNEWCSDWYHGQLAGGDDPQGPTAGASRVYRGGDLNSDASNCRSACRYLGDDPWCRFDGNGFRVVLLR